MSCGKCGNVHNADEILPYANEILPLFASHKLNKVGSNEVNRVRLLFSDLVNQLKDICLPGREYSLVLTKLQEACFFAVKSVSNDPRNQESSDVVE